MGGILRSRLWLVTWLVPAMFFIIAGCGGGASETAGTTATTSTTAPATQEPTQSIGGIGAPPYVFVGKVSIDGSPVPDGAVVTAFIDGKSGPAAQTEVIKGDGSYVLKLEQPSGSDYKGKAVTFTVSDLNASASATWEFGGADEVNLSVSSGADTSTATGGGEATDLAAQGRDIFADGGGCDACHTVEGVSTGMVGPDLTHIGGQGAERKPGLSAKEYITESIRDPEAFVATGVERAVPGIMTQGITAWLSDGEVDALVAFLLDQKYPAVGPTAGPGPG